MTHILCFHPQEQPFSRLCQQNMSALQPQATRTQLSTYLLPCKMTRSFPCNKPATCKRKHHQWDVGLHGKCRALLMVAVPMQDPIWQSLALQDLAFLSQHGQSERWRRAAIFEDASGTAWKLPVQHCLKQVKDSCPSMQLHRYCLDTLQGTSRRSCRHVIRLSACSFRWRN